MTSLGRLKKVALRSVWKGEASDFTPWLAKEENLQLLSEAIGVELEFENTEHGVGPFKADILCKDPATGGYVIIENQLEKTDHTHLGQILTYAAGLNAKLVVWVAAKFTAEHRAAMDFLNEHTSEDLGFFGVEIELFQIGESPVAPMFNVVSKPNDWARAVRSSAGTTEPSPLKQRQLKYWEGLNAEVAKVGCALKFQKPSPQHWNNFSLGKSGAHGAVTINSRESRLGVEVYISHKNSKLIYSRLLEQRAAIDSALGQAVDWMELPDSHACRIAIWKQPFNFEDEGQWLQGYEWMIKTATKVNQVFRPILQGTAFE